MDLQKLQIKVKKIISAFEKDRDKVIKGLEAEIIEFNQEQMRYGFDVNDTKIGTLKSEIYAENKKATGGVASLGNVDLYDDGDFQEKMEIKYKGKYIEPFSKDSKNDDLVAKYGDNIFGLNKSNLEKIQELAKEDYYNIIKDELQL